MLGLTSPLAHAANAHDLPSQALAVDTNATNTILGTGDATATEPGSCTPPVFWVKTVWFRFRSPGGTVKLSTKYSKATPPATVFDTVMTVFEANGSGQGAQVGCNDDASTIWAETSVNTVAGRDYLVQVGGCALQNGDPCVAGNGQDGDVVLTVLANDNRAAPEVLTAGTPPVTRTNVVSSTEPGELLSCGNASYDKTVWFSFDAPTKGTATLDAGGQSSLGAGATVLPVVTVFRSGEQAPAAPCVSGQLIGALGAHATIPIPQAGHYEVQVGSRNSFETDLLQVGYGFTADPDRDGDGDPNPSDCAPDDPSISHRASEILNNSVDENCDGVKVFDRDGDGHVANDPAVPGVDDCDDSPATGPLRYQGNPEILNNDVDENCDGHTEYDRDGDGSRANVPAKPGDDCDDSPATGRLRTPGKNEIAGNAVDENCDGRFGYASMKAPFLSFRGAIWHDVRGRHVGFKVRGFSVTGLVKGARIKFVCRDSGRSCGSSQTFRAKGRTHSLSFRRGGALEPVDFGEIWEVRTWQPANHYLRGAYTRITPGRQRNPRCSGVLTAGTSAVSGKECRPL